MGRYLAEHVSENHRELLLKAMKNVLDSGETITYEVSIPSPEGTRWWSNRIGPIKRGRGVTGFVEVGRDITERKKAEETLRESEERYRSLFEESRDAIIVTTTEGKFVDFNQAALDLLCFTREELMGMNAQERYVNPADRKTLVHKLEQVGSVQDFETRIRRKDGTELDCLYTATVRIASDGSTLYRGIIRDITERKQMNEELRQYRDHLEQLVEKRTAELKVANEQLRQETAERKEAEETLKESEERFRSLFEESRDAILVSDQDGRTIEFNQAALDLFRCTREEMMAINAQERYIDPADRERFLWEIEETGYVKDFEVKLRKKDGTEMICLNSTTSYLVGDGSLLYQGITRDITKWKRTEEALRESEERYRSLFEESLDAIVFTHPDGRTIEFNQAALDLFGCTREEMVRQNARERYADPADRERHTQELGQKGFIKDFEVKLRKRGGTEMGCLITTTVGRASDGSVLHRGTIRDATERKGREGKA